MSRARRQQRRRQRAGRWRVEIERALRREEQRVTRPGPERWAQAVTCAALEQVLDRESWARHWRRPILPTDARPPRWKPAPRTLDDDLFEAHLLYGRRQAWVPTLFFTGMAIA